MTEREISIIDSLQLVLQKYISSYRSTNIGYASVTIASVLFGISGIATEPDTQTFFRGIGFLIFLSSLIYNYYSGRPFGIDISCTPTHIVNGSREPDKMSESRENILIQDDSTIIHGELKLSKFIQDFDIRIVPSTEIQAELQTIPRREHSYNPKDNTLSCSNVTERRFPVTVEVYPRGGVASSGRYHTLKIKDRDSSRTLTKFDVIDVRD